MKVYRGIPFEKNICWKKNQRMIMLNKKDNGIQDEEREGLRYEADWTVSESENEDDITQSVNRMLHEPEYARNVAYEKEKFIKKDYSGLSQITGVNIVFDETFEKQVDVISAKNNKADENIKKLAGNIKNYVADLTEGVRTSETDAEVDKLIADGNIIITNE